MSLNHVTVMGNLTRDPELKEFDGGGCVCNFSIATNYSYKNKAGERIDKATFVEVKVNGPRAKVVKQYFAKGKPIIVEGRLETQSWTDKQTQQQRSKLVVVLENFHFLPKNDGGSQRSNSSAPNQANTPRHQDDPNDIPF